LDFFNWSATYVPVVTNCPGKTRTVVKSIVFVKNKTYYDYHPIAYYWTVPLILDPSYPVGKLTSSKITDTKVSGF
jgi:hypothetical protein